jgi:ABC-type glycerol-3-phosphate transport system substrate-binding protein
MRIRLLLAAAATLALAACGESTAPQKNALRPSERSADDITCRSGYHIATRVDGTQYCEDDGGDAITGAARLAPGDTL